MNFMHQIEPCAERAARLADGGIDFRRYEMLARRERRQAFEAAYRSLCGLIARAVSPMRQSRQGRTRPGSSFREA
jgi:hypothetical protein